MPSPPFVLSQRGRGWLHLLFFLSLAFALWFTVVLLGETLGWTDDPGRWSGLPSSVWALLGLVLFALVLVYELALLVRREAPAQTYPVQVPEPAGASSPVEAEPPAQGGASTVTAEAERPPQT